jgi:glycerol-3-phosphate acyltransferase PlsY
MNIEFWLQLLIISLISYGLGSIPFGVIAGKLAGIDIRSIGSGNIGATNVLRTGRKDLAALTFVGDTGKGAFAVAMTYLFALDQDLGTRQTLMAIAGASAFVGHLFPFMLGFKGGKGVATFLGTLLATSWPLGLIMAGLWLFSAFSFRISSLSALIAAALVAPFGFVFDQPRVFLIMAVFMALLIYWRHKENIQRLLAGTEPRIGQNKNPKTPETYDQTPTQGPNE